ncbi:MAG TPA: hypothetical protein VH328_15400, partial [Burkholderiaceae bacterium]|jgi:hypothetical protein|nr:hypothetical protein [Burkholderiaceae bacterium]
MRPSRKIVGFWHIGAVGDWSRIAAEQYARLKASGLHEASEKIVVGFIGGQKRQDELPSELREDAKLDLFTTADVEDYEFPTLARAWREARGSADPLLCFYMHTKGASLADTSLQRTTNAWRRYMEHFTVDNWEDCVATLGSYETCGVELQCEESHYSGNFWWATSEYLRKLPDADEYWRQNKDNRVAAEFYLCQAHPRAYCFNDCPENLYDYEIQPEDYRR